MKATTRRLMNSLKATARTAEAQGAGWGRDRAHARRERAGLLRRLRAVVGGRASLRDTHLSGVAHPATVAFKIIPATTLRDLPTGTRFRFGPTGPVYVARGNGWYGTPAGYDGGPWYAIDHTPVYPG